MAYRTLFEDTFSIDGPLNPSNWAEGITGYSLVAASGKCEPNGSKLSGLNYYVGSVPVPTDQWLSFTLSNLDWGGSFVPEVAVIARTNSDFHVGYQLQIVRNSDGVTAQVSLLDVAASYAVLYSNSSQTVTDGDKFLLAVQGTTISVYQNDTLFAEVTSSTTSAAGTVSLDISANNITNPGSATIEDFKFGDFIPDPPPTGPTTTFPNSVRAVQLFGRIASGANAGKIVAIAGDEAGNLAVSTGTAEAINSVDVLENGQAQPAMIYGQLSDGSLAAVACDSYAGLCATLGSGGGSISLVDSQTVDYTNVTPCIVYVRTPSGKRVAVPISSDGKLGNTQNALPATALSVNVDVIGLTGQVGQPTPVILVARTPSGHLVAVSLDQYGRLLLAGSGSSANINEVDTYSNGVARPILIVGRNPNTGILESVGLDANANLELN
jgi:hypothetical protein